MFSNLIRRSAKILFPALALAAAFAAPAHAADEPLKVGALHGNWQGIALKFDGEPAFGAMTRMRDGGTAAFVMTQTAPFLLVDPNWNLKTGDSFPVTLTIGDAHYQAKATVVSSDSVVVQDRLPDTRLQLSETKTIVLDLGDLGRWTLDPQGLGDSAKDGLLLMAGTF